jgi:p-aminobenzoyl-glutamate transporter AbgT
MLLTLCIALVCSYVYGKISRNIKNSREFNKSISKTFQNTGFIFAGLFFASIMINILNWTNIS